MFVAAQNRGSSTEDDGSDVDNVITIKTPTSYVFVDVAKNEVTHKPRSRRSSRDSQPSIGDHGDAHMMGDGKIPEKVWEAVEILRAQSKTIMSLDEVQLQDTSTGRSVRSGHSAGGCSTSRSPTISIAQSRLSNRDDSIRVSRESVNVKDVLE